MKKVIVLGGSGAGMVAASVAMKLPDVEFLGFLNHNLEKGDTVGDFKKLPVLGKPEDIETFLKEKDTYFFCAYEGIRDPHLSYNLWKELPIPKDRYINLIDPNAVIPEGFVKVGVGVLAAPFVQVSPDAIISDNVMLLGNAFVGHNSFIGEFSHVTTNSVVGAYVHVGKAVTVGMNSTLLGRVHVGDFTLIGAGSMVTKDVPNDVIVAGNPAKVLRARGEQELNYLKKGERNVNY
ncbi:MAG: hypothetical protein IJK28_09665 [Clostridia bacterium]|nr:hypothetical protein [Clostridia bacterium]